MVLITFSSGSLALLSPSHRGAALLSLWSRLLSPSHRGIPPPLVVQAAKPLPQGVIPSPLEQLTLGDSSGDKICTSSSAVVIKPSPCPLFLSPVLCMWQSVPGQTSVT